MTTATVTPEQDVRQWVAEALERVSGSDDYENAVYAWAGELLDSKHGPIARWSCTDDDCPARPAWDKALAGVYATVTDEIADEWKAVASDRLTAALLRFLAEHPEALRR